MLSIFEFGSKLLETEDLDPVYVTLWKSDLKKAQLDRLILAYSCFYHLGAAAKISEFSGGKFWGVLKEAALNKELKWPRGSERRHFRGKAATDSVKNLADNWGKPEDVVEYWWGRGDATSLAEFSLRVREVRNFGPWIAFKLADIGERLGHPISFEDCNLQIYDEPRKGAALYLYNNQDHKITKEDLSFVIEKLEVKFREFKAPPRYERKVNVQEVESILCKYKSYYNGHYKVGEDILHIRQHLAGWGSTAALLLKNMPKEII
jgi:hypothetical protein